MAAFIFKEPDGTKRAIRAEDISRIERSIREDTETEIYHINGVRVYLSQEKPEDLMSRWEQCETPMMQEIVIEGILSLFVECPLPPEGIKALTKLIEEMK